MLCDASAKVSVLLVSYAFEASGHRKQIYYVAADPEVPLIEGLGLLHKVRGSQTEDYSRSKKSR